MQKVFHTNRAGYQIKAQATMENKDLIVVITGGNVPHIGVILGYDGKLKKQSEIKIYSHNHHAHKDFYLAERFASGLADCLPGNLCVTVGVHVDGITKEQIEAAFTMMDDLAAQIKAWLASLPTDFVDPQYTTKITDQDMHLNSPADEWLTPQQDK